MYPRKDKTEENQAESLKSDFLGYIQIVAIHPTNMLNLGATVINDIDHYEIRRFGQSITIEDRELTVLPTNDRAKLVDIMGKLAQLTCTILQEDASKYNRFARSLQLINRRVRPDGMIEEDERILVRLPHDKISWNDLDAEDIELCFLLAISNMHEKVWHHLQIEFGLFLKAHIKKLVEDDDAEVPSKQDELLPSFFQDQPRRGPQQLITLRVNQIPPMNVARGRNNKK